MFRTFLFAVLLVEVAAAQPKEITNSIGMRLVRIEPGAFTMGFTGEPISDRDRGPSLARQRRLR